MPSTILQEYNVNDVGDAEIGIEIEMEGGGLELDGMKIPAWLQKFDGSLRGTSMEYVMRGPVKREDVKAALSQLETIAKESGATFRPSDRCGVHVHVNVQSWTTKKVFNFITLYLLLENVLVNYCGETREGNLFCLRGQDADWFIQALMQAKRNHTLVGLCRNEFRYASINVNAIGTFGSLEFRAAQTQKKLSGINTWVKMLLAVKDASLKIKDGPAMVEMFSMDGPEAFILNIFGEKLGALLTTKGYERRLEMAARMVQDIAYTSLGRNRSQRVSKNKRRPGRDDNGYDHIYVRPGTQQPLTATQLRVDYNETVADFGVNRAPPPIPRQARRTLERDARRPPPVPEWYPDEPPVRGE